MSRWIPALILAGIAPLIAQDSKQRKSEPPPDPLKKERPQQAVKEVDPPEEDESLAVKEYSFNPLQAEKEMKVGDYYFKKGSFRSAAMRYREATRWNDGYADAWLRLGESQEKVKESKAAREAYTKYLELAGAAPRAAEIRKRLEKLK